MRRALIFLFLFFPLLARASAAPPTGPEAQSPAAPVDCEQAVAAVLAAYPSVQAAEAAVREASTGAAVARWLDRPEIRLRTEAGTRNDQSRLGIRWPLPSFAVPGLRAAARARASAAAAEADRLRAQIAAAVRSDYAAWRFAREQRLARQRLADRERSRERTLREMAAAGTATALAHERAALKLSAAAEEVAQARKEEELREQTVARWTGGLPAAATPSCAPPPEYALPEAVAHHPEVRAARAAAAAAMSEARASRYESWLWPSFLEVNWIHEPEDDTDGVILQAGVRLPLPDRRAAATAARRQQRRLEAAAVAERARAEIAAAATAYRAAREAVERLQRMRGDLTRARDLVARGKRAGADWNEIWQLEGQIAQHGARLSKARHRLELRQIDLRLALGLP